MKKKSFRYASLAMTVLEKLLGTRFTVSGIDKLPNYPVMFVANHFTRSETFFVPYIINKLTGRHVRCLADSKLFVGTFGRFLKSVGTVSVRDENRDKIIIQDLIYNVCDWMIYPEGSMVKSKDIKFQGLYINSTPYRTGPVRTGAAVLALKSQIYRQDLINAYKNENQQVLKDYKDFFGLEYDKIIENIKTCIVPVNITYYPIRPGNNKIKNLALKLIKNLPEQIVEELEIEGNLLLDADINVNFGDPIHIDEYIKSTKSIVDKIPIIKHETRNNIILKYFRSKLTSEFMQKIYSDIKINFDHIFSATLLHYGQSFISINHLKKIIFYSAFLIVKTQKYRHDFSIDENNIYQIFHDEDFKEFNSVFNLALEQNLIRLKNQDEIEIFKNSLNQHVEFHHIRIENTLQVILHEFLLLENASSIVKKVCNMDDVNLDNLIAKSIYESDLRDYDKDYKNNFDIKFSKHKEIGAPYFYRGRENGSNKLGIILVHGYKSAPKEVAELANFLQNFDVTIYCVRLKGHGTSPADIKNYEWYDWYMSVNKGYSALANICDKIVLVGFSMGGLLSLLMATQKKGHHKLAAIVSLNSALKLQDIKAKMVPSINLWNELLEKFNFEKGKLEYVDDNPENPDINYSRNYVKGVYELERLMDICALNLPSVKVPALIVQSTQDPVVNPNSGKLIFNKIESKLKTLKELEIPNHVIITTKDKNLVFQEIVSFLKKIELL